MRALALILAAVVISAASAGSSTHRAGVTRFTVHDVQPFDAFVWYPTEAAEAPWRVGPFPIAASRDAAIAAHERFPIVLLSHGGGGAPLSHRDLAVSLARSGFIVVAPTHVGDSHGARTSPFPLADRARQARKVLDALLADPRFSARVDPARIGMAGFSAGGTTALILSGARPNFERFSTYCRDHNDDRGACRTTDGISPIAPKWEPIVEIRFRAIVLMDPLTTMFGAEDLAPVDMPALLYRPESDDYLRSQGNALALATALPRLPRQITVPGSHFVFIDPCPPEIADEAAAICKDEPGIDRAAVHRRIEAEIADFLQRNL